MFKNTNEECLDIRSLLKKGTPLSEFHFGRQAFRLSADDSDDDDAGGKNLPVRRDDIWQEMLRLVLGYVPEGAEHAPPCNCQLIPVFERCDFAGLAGLPPAVRLMDGFFPVRNQSKRGACFAFALVALCEYMLGKKVELSEQSLFHFTKLVTPGKVESLTDGAFTIDAIHAIEEYGICPLSEWHYNPESWNYVEDPYNEGQGMALQRKLASAQKYRFRHWRTLSNGSVLQFKQALSAGFPVYTGVLVTDDWDDEDVHRTGVIPVSKLVWRIRVMPPPRGLVANILAEQGVDPESDEAELVAMQIAASLIKGTVEYVGSAVFGCELSVCGVDEEEDGIEFVVKLEKISGGHALCLAGYVDDPSYQGGGYFIARNSWSDTEWAPESPEMSGYALIPYAYVAAYGREGIVMAEFPDAATSGEMTADNGRMPLPAAASGSSVNYGSGAARTKRPGVFTQLAATAAPVFGAAPHSTASSSMPPTDAPAQADAFVAWLADHSSVLDRPVRDKDGVLLRPGTAVLIPDPSRPEEVLRDTPLNRAKMRAVFETERLKLDEERRKRKAAEDQERKAKEAEAAAAAESLQRGEIRAIVEASLDRLIPPDADLIREDLSRRLPDLPPPSREWIVEAMHALVAQFPDKYRIATSFDGRCEEIHKVCKD